MDAMQDTPLLVARQNLMLARSLVVRHRYSEAIAPLLTTAEALAFVEQRDPGPIGRDAGYTRQEIKNYTNDIETDPSTALDRVDAWLYRIRQWDAATE